MHATSPLPGISRVGARTGPSGHRPRNQRRCTDPTVTAPGSPRRCTDPPVTAPGSPRRCTDPAVTAPGRARALLDRAAFDPRWRHPARGPGRPRLRRVPRGTSSRHGAMRRRGCVGSWTHPHQPDHGPFHVEHPPNDGRPGALTPASPGTAGARGLTPGRPIQRVQRRGGTRSSGPHRPSTGTTHGEDDRTPSAPSASMSRTPGPPGRTPRRREALLGRSAQAPPGNPPAPRRAPGRRLGWPARLVPGDGRHRSNDA